MAEKKKAVPVASPASGDKKKAADLCDVVIYGRYVDKLKDDSLYLETLRQGFRDYPRNPYFFPRLMDYYTSHKDYHRALRVVNCALEANDSSQLTLFAKATVLFDLGHFDESIRVSEQLLERNDTMPEPYYNIGSCSAV